MLNLRAIYHVAEERMRFAIVGLLGIVLAGAAGIVFLSPSLTLALMFGLVVVVMSFVRPTWTMLFLAWYLPFEPFLLKWIPDDVYVYARYSSELLVYLLVAVVIWRLVSGGLRWRRSPVDVWALMFGLILLTTTLIHAQSLVVALLGVRQIVRFVLLYFVVVQLAPSMRWVKTLVAGLAVVLTVQVVLAGAQAFIGEPLDVFLLPSERRTLGEIQLTPGTVQFWDYGQRVFGTMGRYDQLGTFMAFVMLLIAAMLYESKDAVVTKRLGWLFLASIPVLALTYSRSAWFGFVLGFLFIALWAKRDKRVLLGIGACIATIVLYLGVSGLIVNRLIDVSGQSVTDRFFEAFSLERWEGEYYGLGRMYWVVRTLDTVIPASPLFGHGPASYGAGAVAALRNTKMYDDLVLPFGVYGTEGYIDNNWFSLWGETGTLGLLAYLGMYATLIAVCVRVWRTSPDAEERALALGIAAAMIAVGFNALLATMLEARTLAPYVWMFAGVATVMYERHAHHPRT